MVLQHEGYSVYMQHHPSPTESISGFELFLGAGTEVWCLSGAYVCVLVLTVENLCVWGHWGAIGSSRFKMSPEYPDLHSSLPQHRHDHPPPNICDPPHALRMAEDGFTHKPPAYIIYQRAYYYQSCSTSRPGAAPSPLGWNSRDGKPGWGCWRE